MNDILEKSETSVTTPSPTPQIEGVVPYLSVRGGAQAVEFYETAFDAEELERYEFDGKLGHATLRINGGLVMLADEFPEHEAMTGTIAPDTVSGRTTVTMSLYVDDADAWFARAIAAGATPVRECTDEFFGRHGRVRDPFGHVWGFVRLTPKNESR